MIKANDLRIGNYIRVGGNSISTYQTYNVRKVTPEIIKAIQEENEDRGGNYFLSAFQPIKLTPEILIACGFKDVSPDKNGMAFRKAINNTDELCFYMNDGYMRYQTQGSGFTRSLSEVSTLHGLQNLYYCLRGRELEVVIK